MNYISIHITTHICSYVVDTHKYVHNIMYTVIYLFKYLTIGIKLIGTSNVMDIVPFFGNSTRSETFN